MQTVTTNESLATELAIKAFELAPQVQSLMEASITISCRAPPRGPWRLRRSDAWREGHAPLQYVVGRLFVMSALVVLSCFAVVTRGVRMVFCRLLMVLRCFLRHGGFSSV